MRHLILGGVAALLLAPAAHAADFKLDSSHAQIGFRVQHFGVSYLRGAFGEVTGSATHDDSGTSVNVSIQTKSLITSFPTRTEHALADNFLGAEENPEITFASTGTETKDGETWMTGDLTIRGNTHPVSFPVEILGPRPGPFGNTRMGLTGALTINRLEFGLPFDRNMEDGVPMVGHEVEIDFSVEFIQAKEG